MNETFSIAPITSERLAEVRERFNAIERCEADSLTGHVKGMLALIDKLSTPAAQGTVAAWNYDLDKQPNGMHEVAFDGGIGMCNVRICERYISGPTLIDGFPVPVKDYQYAYREEYGDGWRDVNTRHWRPYAWRHIVIPPLSAPSPEALPASGVEAVGEIVMFEGVGKEVSWRRGKMPPVGTKLYPNADEIDHFHAARAAYFAAGGQRRDPLREQKISDIQAAIRDGKDGALAKPASEPAGGGVEAALTRIDAELDDELVVAKNSGSYRDIVIIAEKRTLVGRVRAALTSAPAPEDRTDG